MSQLEHWQLRSAEQIYGVLGYRTVSAMREAARIGLIPSVQIGRRRLFDLTKLKEWADAGGTPLGESEAEASAEEE